MVTCLKEENSEFKPVKLHLRIDLVLHPTHGRGIGIYIYIYIYVLLHHHVPSGLAGYQVHRAQTLAVVCQMLFSVTDITNSQVEPHFKDTR